MPSEPNTTRRATRPPWVHPAKSLREDIIREIEDYAPDCDASGLADRIFDALKWWGVETT